MCSGVFAWRGSLVTFCRRYGRRQGLNGAGATADTVAGSGGEWADGILTRGGEPATKKRNREGSPLTINALRLESVSDTNGEFVKRVQLRAVNPGMVIHNPDSGVFAHGVLYAGAETFGIAAVSTQAVVAFKLVIGKTGGANEFPSAGAAELLEDQRINTVAADAGNGRFCRR